MPRPESPVEPKVPRDWEELAQAWHSPIEAGRYTSCKQHVMLEVEEDRSVRFAWHRNRSRNVDARGPNEFALKAAVIEA